MLKFKNSEIAQTINFLSRISLKTKASRSRTVLIKKLSEKFEEFSKFQEEIFNKFAKKNKEGELDRDEQGAIHWEAEHIKEGNEALQELLDEEVFINIEEYRPNIKFLLLALGELDMELSGQDALIYDLIMDKLEEETKGE